MPYDEPDATDPMMLIGVELLTDESCWLQAGQVLAEEFARLGFDETRLMQLFQNPEYTGAHRVYLALGEEKIREIIREVVNIWGRVCFRDRDVDPESGMTCLPVLDLKSATDPAPSRRDPPAEEIDHD